MSAKSSNIDFDVAIVGGGPAGLNAAIVLGRSCRRVVLFDHGRPRNYAAQAVHCYVGHDGIAPSTLRDRGRSEAQSYGVVLSGAEVIAVQCISDIDKHNVFSVQTNDRSFKVRALLLATGVIDKPPEIPDFDKFYGRSIHHCPYCDGWEHRDQRLVALGARKAVVELALSLRNWSSQVTACVNGAKLSADDRRRLDRNDMPWREERIIALKGKDGALSEIEFSAGPSLLCNAIFFSGEQSQHSLLPKVLGCEIDDNDLIRTSEKQETSQAGLYVAGDADGEIQFAVVAAAEGAIAAATINRYLTEQDISRRDR
jgi:thioredoxin reductase